MALILTEQPDEAAVMQGGPWGCTNPAGASLPRNGAVSLHGYGFPLCFPSRSAAGRKARAEAFEDTQVPGGTLLIAQGSAK